MLSYIHTVICSPTRTKRGEIYMCVLIVDGQPICVAWNFEDPSNLLGTRKKRRSRRNKKLRLPAPKNHSSTCVTCTKRRHANLSTKGDRNDRRGRTRQPCFKGRERKWRHMKMCTAKYETVTK